MNRIAIALAATLLALPALADGPAPETKPGAPSKHASPGKPRAPATVTERLAAGKATLTVRFGSAATEASVQVHGLDGLAVTSAPVLLSDARVAQGQTVTFDVTFTEGPGRSYLAVSVAGNFSGARRSVVETVTVGTPTAEQQKAAVPPTTDSTGQLIKVMPAQGK
jgi:hypothetical protein